MPHIIINRENIARAIERCKFNHPRVKPAGTMTYAVRRSAGGTALVHFFRDAHTNKCAACDCPAGQRPTPLICYHIAAALALHCARVRHNPEAAIGAASPHFCDDLPQPRPRSIAQPEPPDKPTSAEIEDALTQIERQLRPAIKRRREDEAILLKPATTSKGERIRGILI